MTSHLNQKAILAVSQFAERMALYTHMNNDCLRQMRRYTAEHNDVMSIVQEILQEKHALYSILGLRSHQRKNAVQMMAVYICAARNQDWDFFNQIIAFASKSLPKGAIDVPYLLSLYKEVIRSKNISLAYEMAIKNHINVYSRAFYPVVAICKANILESEHAELILDSALFFNHGRRLTQGLDAGDCALFRYLRITVTDKMLSGTLSDVFPFDRTTLDTSGITFDDFGNYHYRSLTLSHLVAVCSSRAGLLQGHALQSITFNKTKRIELTVLTAQVCLFGLEFDSLDALAQKALDGKQNSFSAREKQMMDRAVNEFSIMLRNVTFLSSCLELYRKSILSALDNEFFNPELRHATQWAQQLEQSCDALKAEMAKEKAAAKELRSQNRVLVSEAADVRNKNAGLQAKIEQQQEYISQLKSELEELQQKNVELQQDIADLLPSDRDAGNTAVPDDVDTTPVDYRSLLSSVFESHKIVIIGGYETSVMAKFAQRNPSAIVIPMARISTSEALIENADAILFKTDHLSHSDYFKVKRIAYKKRIPFDYLTSGTNVQRLEENAAEILSAMGFLE